MILKSGYVAIGEVTAEAKSIKDAVIHWKDETKSFKDLTLEVPNMLHDIEDVEKCEYVVTIKWLKHVSKEEAFWVKGLKANQNSAYKLRNQYTIEKVLNYFNL